MFAEFRPSSLPRSHNRRDGFSNDQPCDCLLKRLFRGRSKKTLKLRVTGLCVRNSPVTGEIPTQKASNAENVSIWWRHHEPQEQREPYFLRCLCVHFLGSSVWNVVNAHWLVFRVQNRYRIIARSFFYRSCSYLVQLLTFVGVWTQLIMVSLYLFVASRGTFTLFKNTQKCVWAPIRYCSALYITSWI